MSAWKRSVHGIHMGVVPLADNGDNDADDVMMVVLTTKIDRFVTGGQTARRSRCAYPDGVPPGWAFVGSLTARNRGSDRPSQKCCSELLRAPYDLKKDKSVTMADPNAKRSEIHETNIVRPNLKKITADELRILDEEFKRLEEVAAQNLEQCKEEATQKLLSHFEEDRQGNVTKTKEVTFDTPPPENNPRCAYPDGVPPGWAFVGFLPGCHRGSDRLSQGVRPPRCCSELLCALHGLVHSCVGPKRRQQVGNRFSILALSSEQEEAVVRSMSFEGVLRLTRYSKLDHHFSAWLCNQLVVASRHRTGVRAW
ncbi:hypothetical protein HU200_047030 [Digitaria exilis]|uniref:Uncharacterized protein n=1 Tax=Digitaria exilis TaxID=1010633 RepID=A0A835AY15_9POAL|nr:hypothetical protein HU200_047030 [Digitaria exilis]